MCMMLNVANFNLEKMSPKNKRKKKPIDKSLILTSLEQLKTEKTPTTYSLSSSSKFNKSNTKTKGFDPHDILQSLITSENDNINNNLRDVHFAYTESPSIIMPNPIAASEDTSFPTKSEGLPGPPEDLKAPVVKSRFVILSWKPPVINNEDIITYSVYYRQEGSKR